MNYKTDSETGFSTGSALRGECFDTDGHPLDTNRLIFILQGSASITRDGEETVFVDEGQFVFIPVSSSYTCEVIRQVRYLCLSFTHDHISFCDKYMLENYFKEVKDVEPGFGPLAVRPPIDLFLSLLQVYLSSGVNCVHLHEIKEKELFILLRAVYTREELVRLFYPIMGYRVDFKSIVLKNKDTVTSRDELARLTGMSVSDLARKFRTEFGESPYSWLLKQKNRRILTMLSFPTVRIKDIINEFNFSTPASFNRYCKVHFGCAPRELLRYVRENAARPEKE